MIATFSVFALWLKVFDWLRMFDATSFYIKLVVKTVKELSNFLILFVAMLAMIGAAMSILQMGGDEVGAEPIIHEITGNFFIDSLQN